MAEQTLTINTLAATVITPSDVSQFSLDDIAPNIINGGGGTIVDVSGIVALASQVAELDSDVTVLEANVATVQADVTALQEDVSGLDATVAQVQTTATAAAETATAASGTATNALEVATQAQATATAASETAQYALNAGNASTATNANRLNYTDYINHRGYLTVTVASNNSMQFTGTDPMGTSADLVVDTAIKANTAQYALKSGEAESAEYAAATRDALMAKSAQYALKAGEAATAAYALAVAGGSSGGGSSSGGEVSELAYNSTTYISVEGGMPTIYANAEQIGLVSAGRTTSLKNTILMYAEEVVSDSGGSSSGGGFDGSYSGSEVRLSASGSTLVLNASSADLAAADSRPLNLSGVEIRLNGHVKTSLGPETFYIGDTSLPDVIKQYAGSGDSSGGGYPPLVQQPTGSNLYYGVVSDNSSLRFGSFGAADGSQAEAVVKVYDDDIYVTSRGGYSNSKQTYGLAVTPPAIRVGTWAGDSPSMYKGMCIPNGVDPAGFMSVGSFIDGTCSYVWGLMADSTTAAFGKVKRSPASGSSINLEKGLQVSEQYVLLANNYNVSGQKSSLEMDADGTTLSAVFTLRSGETTIAPTDWAKLKQLADNADALIALLNS